MTVRSFLLALAANRKLGVGAAAVALLCCLTTPASAVRFHTTDGSIDGSLAVGLDTPSTPTFGFTTFLMMENNLRIKFDDTSSTASFPNNDWSLEANESSNGGRNAFFLRDCGVSSQGNCSGNAVFTVEAGARNNALYVEDDGDIGIGTSTPAVDVHIQTGNTPTLRLAQDGSSGFTPQTWDVAGNETNFFIRDATNGSTLPFRIRPGAPTSTIDVAANGNVGINTASPSDKVHIRDTSAAVANVLIEDTANNAGFSFLADSSGSAHAWTIVATTTNDIAFREDGTSSLEHMTIQSGGEVGINNRFPTHPLEVGEDNTDGNGAHVTVGGVWTDGSSREFKENIMEVGADEAQQVVMNLNPVKYNYKVEPGEQYVGFIAEDVPELVATSTRKHLAPMDIVSVVTKVVQDQQRTIDEQQATIQKLQQRLEQVESQMQD